MTKNELMRLGSVLSNKREINNYTLEQVAAHIGVTHKAVQFWEQGVNEIKLSKLITLCQLYNVTIDQLLEEARIV